MGRPSIAIIGAAETTELGKVPGLSNIGLNFDAAVNALNDAGLKPSDIDGVASGYESPVDIAHQLGIYPNWVDSTSIGGCSWINQLRHAASAIREGLCKTVLITHGESGRSKVAGPYYDFAPPGSVPQQFVLPYGWAGAATLFPLPVLRYMREFGLREEQLAHVAVVQREWAALNPRAYRKEPLTIDDVLGSRMIAYPFRRDMCCLVTDGGGALVVACADRAKDLPNRPVYLLGAGEASETSFAGVAEMRAPLRPEFVRHSGKAAFTEAGINHSDVDHLMIYDAFAHNPIYGLEGLGFVDYGEAGDFIWEGATAIGGKLPMNTNGGGMSYTHTGSYGMFALQESVRQLRGVAPAQVPGVEISVCHGWGGFFSACSTVVLGNRSP